MPDRVIGPREPDAGAAIGRGDANILDFLAQQQGAADLADFALQSQAGASLGGVLTADGAQLSPQPFVAVGDDLSGYTVVSGTVTASTAVTDPAGVGTSLLFTPSGSAAQIQTTSTPSVAIPSGQWVRLVGGVQYHRVSHDVDVYLSVNWYDDNGAAVSNADGTSYYFLHIASIDSTTTDTWLHVDKYLNVPTGASTYQINFLVQCQTVANLSASELTYFNNVQIQGASQYEGVHSGLATRRALWYTAWGRVAAYTQTSWNQAVTSASLVDLQDTGPPVTLIGTSWTPVTGRDYKVTVSGLTLVQSTAIGTVKVFISDGNNVSWGILADVTLAASGAGSRGNVHGTIWCHWNQGPATAGVKLRASASAGSCNITTDSSSQFLILVEDIGPTSGYEPPEGFYF